MLLSAILNKIICFRSISYLASNLVLYGSNETFLNICGVKLYGFKVLAGENIFFWELKRVTSKIIFAKGY